MARAVIGGLITSTLLTLIVVPVVYTYLDDLSRKLGYWWRRRVPVEVQTRARASEVGLTRRWTGQTMECYRWR